MIELHFKLPLNYQQMRYGEGPGFIEAAFDADGQRVSLYMVLRAFDAMLVSLQNADAMAKAIDESVDRKAIGSRSQIADARLLYGEPHVYEYAPQPDPQVPA